MQAPAWSQTSCDLHIVFLSLHVIMWAPSHRGRGFLPEADHMLLHPVQVAIKWSRDLSDGPIKYFSDGNLIAFHWTRNPVVGSVLLLLHDVGKLFFRIPIFFFLSVFSFLLHFDHNRIIRVKTTTNKIETSKWAAGCANTLSDWWFILWCEAENLPPVFVLKKKTTLFFFFPRCHFWECLKKCGKYSILGLWHKNAGTSQHAGVDRENGSTESFAKLRKLFCYVLYVVPGEVQVGY